VNSEILETRILHGLKNALGYRLVSIKYLCLEDEIDDISEFDQSIHYIGGEVHFSFESKNLIVTWDENAGWNDHFSVYAGQEPLFLPDARMSSWDVTERQNWSGFIGASLSSVHIYGENNTPHVLKFLFGDQIVFIGDGRKNAFCDGDDTVICFDENGFRSHQCEHIWELSAGA